MSKTKVNILITALDEGENIKHLLSELLQQKQSGFILDKITVISDGSVDETVKNANSVRSAKIEVKEYKTRAGKSSRINQFFRQNLVDVVVVLDADILLTDSNFLRKLVYPIMNGYDLTSSAVGYIKPRTNVEKSLAVSVDVINNTLNIQNRKAGVFSCRGVARAFSKRLVSRIKFPKKVGDDAFSYFYCKKYGFNYKFVSSAKAIIKLPSHLKDHLKQSIRFRQSGKVMSKHFGKELLESEYKVSNANVYKETFKMLFKKPFYTILYLFIYLYSRFLLSNTDVTDDKWQIATSSKILQ